MFEKIAVRKTWKKLNSGIQTSILELAYLDKNLNSKTYSKEQYLSDCKKLTTAVENLMQNQQIASAMDNIVEIYPFEEAKIKLEGFITDLKMLKKSVAYCKLKLDEKEGIYEPKPTFETWTQSIEVDGQTAKIPFAKRIEPRKSSAYKEMQSSALRFDSFCSNLEDHVKYLQNNKSATL